MTTPMPALQQRRRSHLAVSAGYFAAFVALGLGQASLGPTLTDLAGNVSASLTQISYGFTARGFGYLVGSVLGGRLYDRVKGHPVMGTVLILIAALLAFIPTVSLLWVLIAVLFLLGMSEGALDVGGNTLLVWVHRDQVDPYMNAMHFFFGVGAFLSPIIIAQAVLVSGGAANGGIRWAYWVLALLILPVAVAVFALPSPAGPEGARRGHAGASDEPIRSGRPSAQAPEADPPAVSGPAAATKTHDGRLVGILALFFFLYVGAEGSFGGWIATYAKSTGLGQAATAAYLTSAFWGAITVGRLVSIPLAARFAPRQILLGDLVGCLLSVAVLLFWPGVPLATWLGTFGAGLSMASIFPTAISLAERNTLITGRVTSIFFVGASLGGMTVPWVIGQLFDRVGPQVTTVAIMSAVLLDALVFGLVLWYTAKARRRVGT